MQLAPERSDSTTKGLRFRWALSEAGPAPGMVVDILFCAAVGTEFEPTARLGGFAKVADAFLDLRLVI